MDAIGGTKSQGVLDWTTLAWTFKSPKVGSQESLPCQKSLSRESGKKIVQQGGEYIMNIPELLRASKTQQQILRIRLLDRAFGQ